MEQRSEPALREPPVQPTGCEPDILVVDDDAANLLAIEAALGDLSRQLVKVSSGADALRQLLHHDFALILLDVQMPSMDGFEAARLIRSRPKSRHVPIIFITAFAPNDRDVLKAYSLGAVDFLFKPIEPQVLVAKASVFVELQRRTAEVAHQAAELRRHERQALERQISLERQRWEAEVLRRDIDHQREVTQAMRRRTDELAKMVAERERAEQQLTFMNQQLALADRRKDEFLATLSHELRNPLVPLVNGLELLRLDGQDAELRERVRATMQRQVDHLVRLVDDLLDVARITSGKFELSLAQADLGKIVELGIGHSRPLIDGQHHRLHIDAPPEPIGFVGDQVRLTQVVANLLNNAARYTDSGGDITLRYGVDDGDVFIAVEDTGRGIPPESLEHVFDTFHQASAGNDGLGIGLTLVRRIAQMHGGTVTAASEGENRGSRFEVRFPLKVPETPDEHAQPSNPTAPSRHPLNVVVIEDNPDIRDTLESLLGALGHSIHLAEDGPSGVDLVMSARPDVAIVDIRLPGIDGYEVARRIRTQLATECPRLIAMTGYGRLEERQRAFASGFDAHLVKPVTPAAIEGALAAHFTHAVEPSKPL